MVLDFWLQELIPMALIFLKQVLQEITMNTKHMLLELDLNQPVLTLKITLPNTVSEDILSNVFKWYDSNIKFIKVYMHWDIIIFRNFQVDGVIKSWIVRDYNDNLI